MPQDPDNASAEQRDDGRLEQQKAKRSAGRWRDTAIGDARRPESAEQRAKGEAPKAAWQLQRPKQVVQKDAHSDRLHDEIVEVVRKDCPAGPGADGLAGSLRHPLSRASRAGEVARQKRVANRGRQGCQQRKDECQGRSRPSRDERGTKVAVKRHRG